jgi:hypothetical protein
MYKKPRPQPKKNGVGTRIITPPKQEHKKLLKKIAKTLSGNIKHHPAAHGGVPGRSSFTSARPHCGARVIVTRDIENCYPSIPRHKLFKAFINLGASSKFAKFLSSMMTVNDQIPQGSPTSSLALNLFLYRMDDHFYKRANSRKGTYRRLADDFVISVNSRDKAIALGDELDNGISHRKLTVNKKKRDKKGFLPGDKLKIIHSLNVNSKRGLKPKREHIKKALGYAEHYARCCKCARPSDLLFLASLRQQVTGWMYYCRQAEFSPTRHIRWILERADQKVLQMLIGKGLQPYKNKWWIMNNTRNEPLRIIRMWERELSLRNSA